MRQYLSLVENVLRNGTVRTDRTGTGTRSIFGTQSRYDLSKGFPLCTTKKVNFKPIVEELLWMLRGETNTNTLNAKIWNEWADKDGNLGPIYGAQWRHWGGYHEDGKTIGGTDQIGEAIDLIRNNPTSRRIIINAWNVSAIDDMALPPCHMFFQFYVRDGTTLDCQMYQRSADLALGVPFNVASYSLLTMIIAKECGLVPGEFVHTIGDCHIYLNHERGMREQLFRTPRQLPKLKIREGSSFGTQTYEDFALVDYDPMAAIKFEISV